MTAILNVREASDDDLLRYSADNPGWKIERTDGGALLVSPTSTSGGAKSGAAFAQLYAYAQRAGGTAYDAATGFKTPGGGIVSPDAAWLSARHVAEHRGQRGFWPVTPDIAIEIASPTDSWVALQRKIDKYVADGCSYAIAIDPESGQTYHRGEAPPGFTLDVGAVVAA